MFRSLSFLSLLLICSPALANPAGAKADVISAAQVQLLSKVQATYPGAEVEINIQPLDPRLNLAACTELTAEPRGHQLHGRVHMVVNCMAPRPWRVYLTATVDVLVEVVAARRPVERGVRLTPSDLTLKRSNLAQVQGQALRDFDPSIGYAPKRNLSAGTVLTLPMLQTLPMVRKGETVTLTSMVGQAQISTRAEALESGRSGEQIRVRNTASERVVNAWVTGPGRTATRRARVKSQPIATQFAKSS